MHFSNHIASPVRSSDVVDYSSNSGESTPYDNLSQVGSPYSKSPWLMPTQLQLLPNYYESAAHLVGSLVREEGHVYSLATSSDLLYTGSDSKNIRVWKKGREFSGFKSSSGLVKAIVVAGNRIYTGHQDGKIRFWRVSASGKEHTRVGTLPKRKRCCRSEFWIKRRHLDAVSCLSLSQDKTILYSGSWDKTIKVWRLLDSKCLESIHAHDDAINSVVTGFNGLLFSGSADGTVKSWRLTWEGKSSTKHVLEAHRRVGRQVDSAVTSLAVSEMSTLALLYSGSSDGVVNWWEYDNHYNGNGVLSHGGVLRGHNLAVLCLAAKRSLVLSGSADKSICVWSRSDGGGHTCLAVLRGHLGPVKCLAVEVDIDVDDDKEKEKEKDGCHHCWTVYSGSLDRSVNVWKVNLL